MGLLDRLRGRRADLTDGAAAASTASAGPTAAAPAPADAAADTGRPATAGWSALPPIQRAFADRADTVADRGFGPSLTTWQNPSFTGTLTHAVLDGGPGGRISQLSAAPVRAAGEPAAEVPELPVAGPRPAPAGAPSGTDGAGGAAYDDAPAAPVAVARATGPQVRPVAPAATRPASLTSAPRAGAGAAGPAP
ncbi:hypothetical protein ACWCQH_31195, partial [Streptomyces sp. NPDC002067]